MATLSCAVMAHPKRRDMVTELVEWLDRDVEVVWDRRNDRHDTGSRAMAAYDPSATHHLVVQDDVVPCRDLIAGAERALDHTPGDVPVSLYIGSVKPFAGAVTKAVNAADGDVSWITMEGIYWGPAVILPTDRIDEMLAWYDRSKVKGYDGRMSAWWKHQRKRCWYTYPTLVDHRGDESLAHPKASAGRRARQFVGVEQSALDQDWSGDVIDMRGTHHMDVQRQRRARR